jgi:hypothetical protein
MYYLIRIIGFSVILNRNSDGISSVTYPAIWRCGVFYGRCGCKCGGCASIKEIIHVQWETTASPERDATSPARDAVSPEGDLLVPPNF